MNLIKVSPSLALIFLGGEAPAGGARKQLDQLASAGTFPFTIAADKGANYAYQYGMPVDLIIGDFDSIDTEVMENYQRMFIEFISFPKEKNFGDGEAALFTALQRGFKDIVIFGNCGGRLDHMWLNLALPVLYMSKINSLQIFNEDCVISYSNGETEIKGNEGDIISMVALTPVSNLCWQGVKYPLDNFELPVGSSRCLSNIMTIDKVQVTHDSGVLAIIHYPANYL